MKLIPQPLISQEKSMHQPRNPVHSFVITLLDPSSFINKHIAEGRIINAHLKHNPMDEETKVSLRQFAKDCTEVLESAGYLDVQLPELPTLLTQCVPEMRAGKDETLGLLSSSVETLIFSEQAEVLLNGLLRYVLVDQYQKPVDVVATEVTAIIAHVRLLAPIPLNATGEMLTVDFRDGDAPDPEFIASYLANSNNRYRYRKAFRPHRKDSDKLGEVMLLHTYGGAIERYEVTSTMDVLYCPIHGLRTHIPRSTETLEQLREHQERTLRIQRSEEDAARRASIMNTPLR